MECFSRFQHQFLFDNYCPYSGLFSLRGGQKTTLRVSYNTTKNFYLPWNSFELFDTTNFSNSS